MREAFTLLLGAIGAISAIFVKEAVQYALQRRVISWQLFGYLLAWKSIIVKSPPLLALHNKIEERDKALFGSLSKGSAVFQERWLAHTKERDEFREELKKAVQKAVAEGGNVVLEDFDQRGVELGAAAIAARRALLADSKSFISDKDAAVLGRSVAMNVIQFRSAMFDIFDSIEGVITLANVPGERKATSMAGLVDSIVLSGEQAFVAFIRLEHRVDQLTKRSVPELGGCPEFCV